MMRLCAEILLIVSAILFDACSGQNTPLPTAPVGPGTPQGPAVPLSVVGYGESLDSAYYKVWSDSSWDWFYGDTLINGTPYTVVIDNTGYKTFYGPNGFAGFAQYGGSVVIFDSALAQLPDTMVTGTTYGLQTTFTYQGASHVLLDLETLIDSATVSVPFGTFTDCRVLHSIGAIDNILQYSTYYWLAKGPSDIVHEYDQGYGFYTVQMVYGVVNGQGWGVILSDTTGGVRNALKGVISGSQGGATVVARSAPDISSLAPGILRGARRVPLRMPGVWQQTRRR